jgi:HD-GYP domain-containing protein (c-di-GMP phosphodiesterase class II)
MRVAGLLHDVGKIGVPTHILRKPGKLTNDEYEAIKNHVTLSTLIIHGLPHLADIQDAVANHHERWDGSGYPRGLKGEEIPLLGRVMAVADAFSAMTLDRPYRSGLQTEVALQRIEEGAGTQFDPELARTFVALMRAENAQAQRKAA